MLAVRSSKATSSFGYSKSFQPSISHHDPGMMIHRQSPVSFEMLQAGIDAFATFLVAVQESSWTVPERLKVELFGFVEVRLKKFRE